MPLKDPAARREYHRQYMQRWYAAPENRSAHLLRIRKNNASERTKVRSVIAKFKEGGCVKCGEREPCCLDSHHLGGKAFNVGHAGKSRKSPAAVEKELKKCVCLCSNCHRKLHAGIFELPR